MNSKVQISKPVLHNANNQSGDTQILQSNQKKNLSIILQNTNNGGPEIKKWYIECTHAMIKIE